MPASFPFADNECEPGQNAPGGSRRAGSTPNAWSVCELSHSSLVPLSYVSSFVFDWDCSRERDGVASVSHSVLSDDSFTRLEPASVGRSFSVLASIGSDVPWPEDDLLRRTPHAYHRFGGRSSVSYHTVGHVPVGDTGRQFPAYQMHVPE
jgi:hypothetical protein